MSPGHSQPSPGDWATSSIFATLGSPDAGHGMVALLAEQQDLAIDAEPDAFRPAAGAWGRGGSTLIELALVSDAWLERTIRWAWEKRAPAKRSSPSAG